MDGELTLIAVERDGATELCAPLVGTFTQATAEGAVLQGGAHAGYLIVLGVAHPLVVPAGVTGIVSSRAPERVHEPVGYKSVLYRLAPLEGRAHAPGRAAQTRSAGGLAVRSPQSGRFWHRAAPGDPPLAAAGAIVEAGAPLGLIEVMKTFAQVLYRPEPGQPPRARIARVLAADGAEVDAGTPLFEIAAA